VLQCSGVLNDLLTYCNSHKEILTGLGVFSVVSFVATLILIPILCVRMGEDYFMPHRDMHDTLQGRHPVIRWAWVIFKQCLGIIVIVAGILMLVLPGQGVLTVIIGIMLLHFPGKRALELRLIRIPAILKAINALRQRSGHGPLQLPERTE
jgi:hypothetical protein